MKKYVKHVGYILQHKWYVFIECWKEGLYWQGLVHDLSKFSPVEFSAYAWNFFVNADEQTRTKGSIQEAFLYAWLHHQHKNKHHWHYWVVNPHKKEAVPMPEKYIIEMICDWRAMARKFGDTVPEHFQKHHHRMVLHPDTFERIQQLLDVQVTPTNVS
jgi:hypothetical protein